MGKSGDKIEEERDRALQEFKDAIKGQLKPEHEDYYLHKWLKARSYDVAKAANMYTESMAYREKMKLDTLLSTYKGPEVLEKYMAGGFAGFDKEGSPVKVELFGHIDMKGLMYSLRKVELELSKCYQCEQITEMWRQQSSKLGRRVDGMTVVFDMENVSAKWLWRPGMNMYLHLVKVLEDNYPEMVRRLMVVNAPAIFPLLWKISRHLVSEDMKNKIFVLGSDYKDALLTYIDEDQLPAYLGGTMTDPDGNPRCPSKICQGGEVPESYYQVDNIDLSRLKKITINQGGQYTVSISITRPGSIIKWEFKTEANDIAFGVNFINGDNEEVLINMERVNSHMVPEDGSLTCKRTGMYKVVFDNSFSWMRSKVLYYSVDLIASDLDEGTKRDVNQVSGGAWESLADKMEKTSL